MAKTKVNSREALFGFMGWLTSRNVLLKVGSKYDAAGVADLIVQWADHNALPPVSAFYPDNISHPK